MLEWLTPADRCVKLTLSLWKFYVERKGPPVYVAVFAKAFEVDTPEGEIDDGVVPVIASITNRNDHAVRITDVGLICKAGLFAKSRRVSLLGKIISHHELPICIEPHELQQVELIINAEEVDDAVTARLLFVEVDGGPIFSDYCEELRNHCRDFEKQLLG